MEKYRVFKKIMKKARIRNPFYPKAAISELQALTPQLEENFLNKKM